MGPETSFWPQRAVKEALALPTANELVRAQGWGRHWLEGEGLSPKLGSTEPGVEAARRGESACVCTHVSCCGLPLVPGL